MAIHAFLFAYRNRPSPGLLQGHRRESLPRMCREVVWLPVITATGTTSSAVTETVHLPSVGSVIALTDARSRHHHIIGLHLIPRMFLVVGTPFASQQHVSADGAYSCGQPNSTNFDAQIDRVIQLPRLSRKSRKPSIRVAGHA